MFDTLQHWVARRRRAPILRRPADWVDAMSFAAAGPTDGERPPGCGWFDSSHELRAGLLVQEHGSPDAVANELPLGDWLQLHLAESRSTARR
jgi:hypothetical protein